VLERDGKVLGGCGVAPLTGGDPGVCELRKMYFLKEARGAGAGAAMMTRCLDAARQLGFKQCYLETLPRDGRGDGACMSAAASAGSMDRMGATGHGGCNAFYLLDL